MQLILYSPQSRIYFSFFRRLPIVCSPCSFAELIPLSFGMNVAILSNRCDRFCYNWLKHCPESILILRRLKLQRAPLHLDNSYKETFSEKPKNFKEIALGEFAFFSTTFDSFESLNVGTLFLSSCKQQKC